LQACEEHQVFGENVERGLVRGDLLLLQQIKAKALNPRKRIEHVMQFERYVPDSSGESLRLSRTRST
jgi:hypothetical protein